MSDHEWNEMRGLRDAAISLTWRTAVALVLWFGSLWGLHAILSGFGIERFPRLLIVGFCAITGSMVGAVISRGLDERAGFVSPILTVMAAASAAIAVFGGGILFEATIATAEDHLRYLLVAVTLIVAGIWIVRGTLLDT